MVKEELEKLAGLQKLDDEIAALRDVIEAFPKKLKEWEQKISRTASESDSTKKEHTRVKVLRREKESALKAVEDEVKKLQKVLNDVKTNKEYTSVLAEIKSHQGKISDIESEVLDLMEKDDALVKREKDFDTELGVEKKRTSELESVEREKVKRMEEECAAKTAERNGRIAGLDNAAYQLYERIRKGKKDGVAICRMEGDNGKEMCAGCSVFVPTYIAERVKKKNDIVQCENCSRILC